MPAYQLIAALGSSFAAAPGIEPVADAGALRSGRNYAHQLAERLGARLVDLTVSGAGTANLVDTPQQMASGLMFPPMFPDGIPLPTDQAVEQATAGLVRAIEEARVKAPAARVLLVDYLTVLSEGSGPATPFSAEELARLFFIQGAVGQVFADAASRTGAELVLASTLSAGHALGSPEPWVQPFNQVTAQDGASFREAMMRTGASFHPNEAGMAAIAAELERVLGG